MSEWPSTRAREYWQHSSVLDGRSRELADRIELSFVRGGRLFASHFTIAKRSVHGCWLASRAKQDFDQRICSAYLQTGLRSIGVVQQME